MKNGVTRVEAALDLLVPPFGAIRRDWERVVSDAATLGEDESRLDGRAPHRGRRPERTLARRGGRLLPWRGRRILAVAIAAVIAVPLAAASITQGWWFSAFHAPSPAAEPVVVKQGTWEGHDWVLVAYWAADQKLCFSVSPAASVRAGGAGASMSCGGFSPDASLTTSAASGNDSRVGYMIGYSPELPAYAAGPVVSSARSVTISFADGHILHTATFPAPSSLGAIRFYAALLPPAARPAVTTPSPVAEVLARDAKGRIVACLAVQRSKCP